MTGRAAGVYHCGAKEDSDGANFFRGSTDR